METVLLFIFIAACVTGIGKITFLFRPKNPGIIYIVFINHYRLIIQITIIVTILGFVDCQQRLVGRGCTRSTGQNSWHDDGCDFQNSPYCTRKFVGELNPQILVDYCYGCDYYNQDPRWVNDNGNAFCVERLARSTIQQLQAAVSYTPLTLPTKA